MTLRRRNLQFFYEEQNPVLNQSTQQSANTPLAGSVYAYYNPIQIGNMYTNQQNAAPTGGHSGVSPIISGLTGSKGTNNLTKDPISLPANADPKVVADVYGKITWPTNVATSIGNPLDFWYNTLTPEEAQHRNEAESNLLQYGSFSRGLAKTITQAYSTFSKPVAEMLLKQYDTAGVFETHAYRPGGLGMEWEGQDYGIREAHLPAVGTINTGAWSSGGPGHALPDNRGKIAPKAPNSYSGPRDVKAEIEWMRYQDPTYHPVFGNILGPSGFHYDKGPQALEKNPEHKYWVKTGGGSGPSAYFEVNSTGTRYVNPKNLPAGIEANDMSTLRPRGTFMNMETGATKELNGMDPYPWKQKGTVWTPISTKSQVFKL